MDSNQIFALGLGLTPPWKLVERHLDVKWTARFVHKRAAIGAGNQADYVCRRKQVFASKPRGLLPAPTAAPLANIVKST